MYDNQRAKHILKEWVNNHLDTILEIMNDECYDTQEDEDFAIKNEKYEIECALTLIKMIDHIDINELIELLPTNGEIDAQL